MENIKLSTGQEVPPVGILTDQQVWDFVFWPIDYETPVDVKNYLQEVNKEFFKRRLQFRPMPFTPVPR